MQSDSVMHSLASVQLARPQQEVTDDQVDMGAGTHTITFTDSEGNVITSVMGDTLNLGGVTVVPNDTLGPHFLTPVTLDGVNLKLEHVAPNKMEVVDPVVLNQAPSQQPFEVVVKKKTTGGPENEKKICLWPMGNGTTCGKAFAKFDSLKRHLTEAHKGVRPFACKLCDKTYGRRDYLQRHLKSHNASYAVNLAGGNAATLSSCNAANKVKMESQQTSSTQQQPTPNLTEISTTSNVNVVNPQTSSSNSSVASMPLLNLYTMHNQAAPKPLGSKICRWVQDDGTVCGKAFCKLDSLRRHVNELHKGVRPFACTMCDKNYGRKDYLDRHVKTHDPTVQKRKPGIVDWGSTSGVVSLLNSIKEETPKSKIIKKKRRDIPAEEKKICLWVLEDGTACGKTFTKFDSLKRHVSEGHRSVRPYGCTLCGKTYGRRDYLLRHLRSHNEADLANLASHITTKTDTQVTQIVTSPGGGNSMLVSASGSANTLLSSLSNSSANMDTTQPTNVINATTPTDINRVMGGLQLVSSNSMPLAPKLGLKKRSNDKKTCRWVLDSGAICGRSFSKFDSMRRHVQELHKGVRPFACNLCDRTYGRKDYLDRHVRSHAVSSTSTTTLSTVTNTVSASDASKTLIVNNTDVLASLDDKDQGSQIAVILDEDEDMKAEFMEGGVVAVVGAVDDEDDELAV